MDPPHASQRVVLNICFNWLDLFQFLVELFRVHGISFGPHKSSWMTAISHSKIQKWTSLITEKIIHGYHFGSATRVKNNLSPWKPNTTRKF